MEDSEKNYQLFEHLMATQEENDSMTDCYSMYILENKYLFFFASDLPKPTFQEYLHNLVEITSEPIRLSQVAMGIQNVRTAYTSVCRAEQNVTETNKGHYPLVELQLLQEAIETDNMDKIEFALRMIKNDFSGYEKELRADVLEKIVQQLSLENPQAYADITFKKTISEFRNGLF